MLLQEGRVVFFFFKHNFVIDFLGIHHISQSYLFPSPSISALYPCSIPPLHKRKLKKILIKKNNNQKSTVLLCLSILSIISSFILMALRPAVYHVVDTFVQTTLFANVLCVVCCQSSSRLLASDTPSILKPH